MQKDNKRVIVYTQTLLIFVELMVAGLLGRSEDESGLLKYQKPAG